MKKVILALMLCSIGGSVALADKPPTRTVRKHKPVAVVPPVVVPPPIAEVPPAVPVVPEAPPVPVVVPPPVVAVIPPVAPKKCPGCPPESTKFIPSLHLGIGVGAQAPWASGTVGLRFEFPVAYLAIEPFVSLPAYGFGADLIVYAYRGKIVQFSPLSVGFMINAAYLNGTRMDMSPLYNYLSVQDVDRLIDLRLGLGVQVKVACGIKLAFDLRTSIPDPVKLSKEDGVCHGCTTSGAKALDAGNVIGKAFSQTQLVVGVLF